MTSRKNWIGLLAALGAVIGGGGCGGTGDEVEQGTGGGELGLRSQALVGSTFVPETTRPEIGAFLRNNYPRCGAVLILPDVALTTARCVDNKDQGVFGDAFVTGSGVAYGVKAIHVMGARIVPAGPNEPTDRVSVGMQNDLALLHLLQKVPSSVAKPAKIADTLPANNERVTQFGVGCIDRTPMNQTGSTGRRSRTWTFTGVRDSGPTTNICDRDAGGPLVKGELAAGGAVWALNAAVDGPLTCDAVSCSYPDAAPDVFANVVWRKEEILDVVRGWVAAGADYDVDRPGGDLTSSTAGALDMDSCWKECAKNLACRGFVYTRPTATVAAACKLKKTVSGWVPKPGVISRPDVNYENQLDRPGATYKTFDLSSGRSELCRAACGKDPSCKAYTYVGPTADVPARCQLKSSAPTTVKNLFTVSGVKRNREVGFDRPGADVGYNTGVASVDACERKCTETPVCKAFTYVTTSKECFLKGAVPAAVAMTGAVSGVKRGLEARTDRPGQDYQSWSLRTGAPEECQWLCDMDPACQSFSFVPKGVQFPSVAVCYLKSGIPASTISNVGVVSGIRGVSFF